MLWNKYKIKPSAKTAFELIRGKAIFSDTLYLVNPIYIRRNSPKFTLVSKGKHLTGLFAVTDRVYSGDYKGSLVVVMFNPVHEEFELILTDIPTKQGLPLLESGELNQSINQARSKGDRV